MATTFAKGLFGVDPAEYSMQQQKLWSNLYAQASSPYEKMGIALAQIGGTAFGLTETPVDKKIADISKVLNDIGTQYQVGTAEYYKAVADALPAEYPDAKAQAQAEFIKFKQAETKTYTDAVKVIKDNPETVDTFADPLKVNILKKATTKGWNEAEVPVPTTSAEMTDFVKKFGLTADPDFRRYTAMYKIAEKEGTKEKQEEKKRGLDIENIELTIKKNTEDLKNIGNDFKQGARWNEEREAALKLLTANGIDWTKPLERRDRMNPELVTAQKLALRNPWTGAAASTITPAREVTPPAPRRSTTSPAAPAQSGWSATVVPPPAKK
jgi:hypothetical protein